MNKNKFINTYLALEEYEKPIELHVDRMAQNKVPN